MELYCFMSVSVREVANKRPVAQLAERRSPKPKVGGSMPSWPAKIIVIELLFDIKENEVKHFLFVCGDDQSNRQVFSKPK